MSTIAGGAVKGREQKTITTVTTTYTVLNSDEFIQADATAGNFTVSLPLPSTMTGQTVRVQQTSASNTVTVDGVLPQYIRAAGKSTLGANKQAAYISDGTYWNNVGTVS